MCDEKVIGYLNMLTLTYSYGHLQRKIENIYSRTDISKIGQKDHTKRYVETKVWALFA